VTLWQGGSADGCYFGVGGSGPLTAAATGLGNLTFQYNTWTDTTNFTVNGTAQPVNDFKTGVSYGSAWFTPCSHTHW
jgi:hypothetical protein